MSAGELDPMWVQPAAPRRARHTSITSTADGRLLLVVEDRRDGVMVGRTVAFVDEVTIENGRLEFRIDGRSMSPDAQKASWP